MEKPYNLEKLGLAYGNVKEISIPSGFKVVIREQNGEDDDTLSRVGMEENIADNLNNFVESIIVGSEKPIKSALSLRLRDKYTILINSRIFSLGEILYFKHDWKIKGQPEVDYEENLQKYIWDYSRDDFPFEDNPEFFKYRIKPYKAEIRDKEDIEITLSSNKKIKFKYIDGFGEKFLLEKPLNQITINDEFRARNLKLYLPADDNWVLVESFKVFSPRDMMELRNTLENTDERVEGYTDIINPYVPGSFLQLPLLQIRDFFFPREM